MSIAKQIAGRIWALWGLVIFVITLFIFVWPITFTFLIKEPTGVKIFKSVSRFWMTLFLYAIGCPMRVVGKENYDASQQYVVTANHRSFMDVPLLTPFFPGPNKTIAKRSMARIPFFGWIYARGSVLVDRGSDASRKRSYEAMKQVLLQQHLNMAVYPEGTRNRTEAPLKPFYDGAFKLAVECEKAIIPVVMQNTAKALPPSRFFFLWPTPLYMHVLAPIPVANKTATQLKEEVFKMMTAFINTHGV